VINRRDLASRLPDLAEAAARLEPLRHTRPAIPMLYVEFADSRRLAHKRTHEAAKKRAIAAALRASLGTVLRKGDVAAAGPGAQWFVALLIAKARKAKTQIVDADLGIAAERLRRAVHDALTLTRSRSEDRGTLRCGWTVLELDHGAPLAALRQAVRGAAVVARIEERRATTLAAVTHELRTPLTAIVGFAERLRSLPADDPQCSRAAEVIADEAQRLVRLTEGLIDIGAWTAGHLVLRRVACDVGVLAKAAVESVADRARAKRLRIRVTGGAGILADKDRCYQVLLNLLDNAVRHSPEAGRVDVTVRSDGKRCTIAVADQGPGFPAAVRRGLGRPFTRGVDGSVGLGIAISKVLVEAHGGEIRAGDGRRGLVVVTLPTGPERRPRRIPQDRTGVCE